MIDPQEKPKFGPRGGDLTNPKNNPEYRTSPFKGQPLSNGGMTLHRFEPKSDVVKVGRLEEQPWMRLAAYMVVNGRTNSEIAMSANRSVETVQELRAQRWFQELIVTIANSHGEAVAGALEGETLASIEKLRDLRDGAESERVQFAAAVALLEHSTGKPVQKTITAKSHDSKLSPKEEYDQLEQELAAIRKKNAETAQS
jgi:hypothetical protein